MTGIGRTTRQCPVNGCGARAGRPRGTSRRNRTAPRPCYRALKTAKSGRAETCRRVVLRPTIERPQCKPHGFFMKCLRFLTAVTLLAAAAWRPALAADATFPPGVRVGLAPLVGLSRAKSFTGFESEDQSVKVLVTELPPDAYSEVSAAFKANPAGVGGVKPEKIETPAGTAFYTAETAKDGANTVRRYSMILSGGTFSGYVAVQVPDNATKIYSDDAVRQMFASTVTRKNVPVEEQLGLMPFNVTELSSFKNVRTLAPGAALVLADGDETTGFEPAPFMVIGVRGVTNGPRRFHASAPCATEFSRAADPACYFKRRYRARCRWREWPAAPSR